MTDKFRTIDVDLSPEVVRLLLEGQLTHTRTQMMDLDGEIMTFRQFEADVKNAIPAELHEFIDWNRESFERNHAEHVVTIRLSNAHDVRALFVRESSDSTAWVQASWSATSDSFRWAIVNHDDPQRQDWTYAATLTHALYLAVTRSPGKRVDRAWNRGTRANGVQGEMPPGGVLLSRQFIQRQSMELEGIRQAVQMLRETVKSFASSVQSTGKDAHENSATPENPAHPEPASLDEAA